MIPPGLPDQVRDALQVRHDSINTEEIYIKQINN